MRIGILTYGRIANFGANLQSTSTYIYLLKKGHTPIYIYYLSEELFQKIERNRKVNPQIQAHYDYFDSIVKNSTALCHSPEDINRVIKENGIEAVVIGADAVLQHHPLLSRIKLRKALKPYHIQHVTTDRLFPNLFWGFGIDKDVKMAMMSVSCQNSEYKYFTPLIKHKMKSALQRFCYISVRDNWTKRMVKSIDSSIHVVVTPDPVFAFNQNMAEYLPSKADTLKKFGLPEKYVCISMFRQSLDKYCLDVLKSLFKMRGISCVVLPMPDEGVNFEHSYDFVISSPLSPIDWYAIIKYSQGYIGENMHPIVISLHNAVPCYSLDNWGATDFFRRAKNNGSSKVEDILNIFEVSDNRSAISKGRCNASAEDIFNAIINFPCEAVKLKAAVYYHKYIEMMEKIVASIS